MHGHTQLMKQQEYDKHGALHVTRYNGSRAAGPMRAPDAKYIPTALDKPIVTMEARLKAPEEPVRRRMGTSMIYTQK